MEEDPDPPSLQTIAENRAALSTLFILLLKEAGLARTWDSLSSPGPLRPGGGVMESGIRSLHLKHLCSSDPPAPKHWDPRTSHPQQAAFCLLLLQLLGCVWGGAVEGEGRSLLQSMPFSLGELEPGGLRTSTVSSSRTSTSGGTFFSLTAG